MSFFPTILVDRFVALIEGLRRSLGASQGLVAPVLVVLACARLNRLRLRFEAVVARLRDGTYRPPPSRPRPAETGRASSGTGASPRMPRRAGWLLAAGAEVWEHADQLRHVVTDPEMTALIARAPELGRMLRPMCRMLGIDPPEIPQAAAPPDTAPEERSPVGPVAPPPPPQPPQPPQPPAVSESYGDGRPGPGVPSWFIFAWKPP